MPPKRSHIIFCKMRWASYVRSWTCRNLNIKWNWKSSINWTFLHFHSYHDDRIFSQSNMWKSQKSTLLFFTFSNILVKILKRCIKFGFLISAQIITGILSTTQRKILFLTYLTLMIFICCLDMFLPIINFGYD